MTDSFEKALGVLGIDGSTSTSDAHRAYIRKLKTCSPERDPKGFTELRAAYELVRDRLTKQSAATADIAPNLSAGRGELPRQTPDLRPHVWRIENPEEWKGVYDLFAEAVSNGDTEAEMPVMIAVETIGALVAIGRTKKARILLGALSNWLQLVGETRALPGDLAVHFPVIRDLVAVASLLPRNVSRWLGRHVIRMRLATVQALLDAHVTYQEELATSILEAIEGSQSVLAKLVRKSIDAERHKWALRRRKRTRERILLAVIIVLVLAARYWGIVK